MPRQHYNINMRPSRHPIGMQRAHGFQWERLLCLVLLAALIAALCICVPSMKYREESRKLYIARMQTECDTALTYSKYLSRTASSNSNAQLAVIRSSIYSMDVVNQTYMTMEGEGSYLVSQNTFSNLYNVLDNYFNKLTTGTNTSDHQTELTQQLEALKQIVSRLD